MTPIHSHELIHCVTEIVTKYFASQKMLTYVGDYMEDAEFLKAIQDQNIVMMSKSFTHKLNAPHEGYLLSAGNYTEFTELFPLLTNEWTWNPEARFLIIVRSLEYYHLEHIFNTLLKLHVNNVIVINGTIDADLYSYNPFDNYACGKHYDDIIRSGKCSQAYTQNLFPNKYVTLLRNCTFTVSVPHWPPYAIHPANITITSMSLSYGIEPYLLRLVGEMCGFTVNFILDKGNSDSFSTVSLTDMKAVGALKQLQDFKADIVLGGLMLVPNRAYAFSYVHEFLPYIDEIRFAVKEAELVAAWKIVYLEFDSTVWLLLVLSMIIYSLLMIMLLRVEDRSGVVLKLLDNLVLHSCKIQGESTVKCVFIAWVWFAYLINAFYQSSLVSLTTNPPSEKQISTEADIMAQNLKPCFSNVMYYYYLEATKLNHTFFTTPGCQSTKESIRMIFNSKEYYSIILYGVYKYNVHNYFRENRNHYVYTLAKPYSKVIYSTYFYKGFPLIDMLCLRALRVREVGLVTKAIDEMNHLKITRHGLSSNELKPRFAMPWCVYILGGTVATITFIWEILSIY